MAKRAPKRAGRAKTTTTAKPTQPMLPNIVAGALAVGTEVGRAALRVAQDVLGAAGRLAARAATSSAEPKILGPAGPPIAGDSRLPEAQLNAIAEARRPASRKPLAPSAAQTGKVRARRRRRKTA